MPLLLEADHPVNQVTAFRQKDKDNLLSLVAR
jgi:hypothetical protein